MMPALSLHNFLSWMAQISVIVLVGTLLPRLFSIRHPQSHLLYSRLLLAMCMFVPFLQPWQNMVVRDSANGQSYFPVLAIAPAILQLDPSIPLERVIFYALFAGIFLKFCWFLAGMCQIRRYRMAAIPLQPLPDSVVLAQKLVNCDAAVYISLNNVGPVTFGLGRPTILLPESFLSLEEDSQLAIVCHELLHVKRNDWFATVIEELAGILLWFHPAVWWLLGQTRLAREKVVDAEVIRRTIARQPYIDALLAIAGAGIDNRMVTAPLFLQRGHLIDRMKSLLAEPATPLVRLFWSYASVISILVITSLLTFITFPLMAEPQINEPVGPVRPPLINRLSSSALPETISAREGIYRVGAGVTAPVLITQVAPQYSDLARQERIQGSVILEGIVETDGAMSVTRIARSLHPTLDHNAIYALKQWRFEPGRLNGVAVRVQLEIEVSFNVK
jgi:TonB family protein